ncbi:MAG TPA: RICIN domain-containing protein [Bryobacteraceae bacterium]|nr:RICIN domain-containing protein [Bryobacteraceae bacterium]
MTRFAEKRLTSTHNHLISCGRRPNQTWQLVAVDGQYYQIVSTSSGKVLDVVGAGHENRYRYSGSGRANQEWQFVQLPYFQIVSKASGQVLDVYAAQTNQGTPVDIAQAVVGAPNQEWMLVAAGTPLPPACSQSVGR